MPAAITKALGDAYTGTGYATIDAKEQQRRLTRNFTQYEMPQLKSTIASTGQWYSSARQDAEKRSNEGFIEGSYDIQSALQRQTDDFTRQRMYAALGIVL